MNIGTITGKYHQRALALKGITVQEFQKIRDEFRGIVLSSKFSAENEQGQERSVVSLETQREILANKEQIVEGLSYIKSQYDFVETFPLVGHGLRVHRQEGSFVNPWIIRVKFLAQ